MSFILIILLVYEQPKHCYMQSLIQDKVQHNSYLIIQRTVVYAGFPTNNTTNAQPAASGMQSGITVVAVVGWLILLGVVLVVVILFYRYKRKQKKRT